jgi:cephalosporin hydroxylase
MIRKIINLLIMACLAIVIFIEGIYLGPHYAPASVNVRGYHIAMYQNAAMWELNWMGVPTIQNPNDVWIIQEIISEMKPDFIVETGTSRGGSALIWATILQQVNPQGKVISVDIEDLKPQSMPPIAEKIDFLIGSSVDPNVVESIRRRVRGKSVLVLLDSNHHKDHVFKELQSYWEIVPVGSYIIVQDTNVSGHPVDLAEYRNDGPMEAVEKFLSSNDRFVSDKSREKLLFTMHPDGYLKRIR